MDNLPEGFETVSSNCDDGDSHKKCKVVVQMLDLHDNENDFDLSNLNGRADDDCFTVYKNHGHQVNMQDYNTNDFTTCCQPGNLQNEDCQVPFKTKF